MFYYAKCGPVFRYFYAILDGGSDFGPFFEEQGRPEEMDFEPYTIAWNFYHKYKGE